MSSDENKLESNLKENVPAMKTASEKYVIPERAISRRAALAGGTAASASLLLGRMAKAESLGGAEERVSRSTTLAQMASPCT